MPPNRVNGRLILSLQTHRINSNGTLGDYDMSIFLFHPLNKTLGVQIKSLTTDEISSPNSAALTFVYAVLMMIISGIVLYLVYGRGSEDSTKTKVKKG